MEVSEKTALSSEVVQSLSEDINKLSLSNTTCMDINDCMQTIVKADFQKLKLVDKSNASKSNSDFNLAVKCLMKFSHNIFTALKVVGKSPGQAGTVYKVATVIVGLFFAEDVSSVVAKRFENTLDADLRAKCRATCVKISHCINYMQGLPYPGKLRDEEKKMHLLLMATDVPVQTGLDEVLYLGEKIREMVQTATGDMSKFDCLMNNVELYCCLATFRELFLLYRFAFQSLFEVNAESVKNVLESQISNDQSVLEFLHKPTIETAKLYYNVQKSDWPLSKSFCERRELVVEDLACLNKGVYKIQSVQTKHTLHTKGSSMLGRKAVCGVYLESSRRKKNVFSIQSDSQYLGESECTKYVGLSDGYIDWYILKVHGSVSSDKPCFLIWLDSDIDKCMCDNSFSYTMMGTLYPTSLATSKELGSNFFWTLEPI
ncbi:uncharacterized protein LOC123565957 [Mercenaria mercenaria]|uniref:uncharacterized protein LOC123565957 n=1 Tax=Mercenaria mercenaria TaxID=6596 RepID=UPI00234F92B1|nr:uncharacterized protein LOC123565957 [Mercenaria mercenaria]XP_053384474.1 uncharacterized protein LOC123565957 [Mercenaria mercenaria]XP_053384476.1 uncharacterized protein LOC123565957 [Mercenaria mercenaria]